MWLPTFFGGVIFLHLIFIKKLVHSSLSTFLVVVNLKQGHLLPPFGHAIFCDLTLKCKHQKGCVRACEYLLAMVLIAFVFVMSLMMQYLYVAKGMQLQREWSDKYYVWHGSDRAKACSLSSRRLYTAPGSKPTAHSSPTP